MSVCRRVILAGLAGVVALSSGCILGNRPTFVGGGSDRTVRTYYLDGAGNYGFGKETVPLGLEDAGYRGGFEHFIWTSYLGTVMDQVWYDHNRDQGRRLAGKIQGYLDKNPGAEVNIIALSAGTGVAVFALEQLRPPYRVGNVILLSSSLSANYDLTRALRRVDGKIYFFWSPNDPVLRGVVPILGTVDRRNGSMVAGATGARLPWGAVPETRQAYQQKVQNIRWHTSEIEGPVKLYHAGTTDRGFIRDMVAPILVRYHAQRLQPSPVMPAAGQLLPHAPAPRPAAVP